MTKEQVQKHGEVIKWFCDNPEKGVWLRSPNGGWTFTRKPFWDIQCKYVQNDEYAELRKAQADNKIIEHKSPELNVWYTKSKTSDFNTFTDYRIKPDEPKFKVDDWVYTEEGYLGKIISHIYNNLYNISGLRFNAKVSRLWTPKEGDVVIFLDEPTPRILKLQTCNMMYAKSLFVNSKCIPYIGQPFEEIK